MLIVSMQLTACILLIAANVSSLDIFDILFTMFSFWLNYSHYLNLFIWRDAAFLIQNKIKLNKEKKKYWRPEAEFLNMYIKKLQFEEGFTTKLDDVTDAQRNRKILGDVITKTISTNLINRKQRAYYLFINFEFSSCVNIWFRKGPAIRKFMSISELKVTKNDDNNHN